MSEHDEQVALFQWAAWQVGKWPVLDKLFAIPNGSLRHKIVAAKLKAEGVKAGIPDICLPTASKGYHGLYIELKDGKNTSNKAQKARQQGLADEDNLVAVCWGWESARNVIMYYLEHPELKGYTPDKNVKWIRKAK